MQETLSCVGRLGQWIAPKGYATLGRIFTTSSHQWQSAKSGQKRRLCCSLNLSRVVKLVIRSQEIPLSEGGFENTALLVFIEIITWRDSETVCFNYVTNYLEAEIHREMLSNLHQSITSGVGGNMKKMNDITSDSSVQARWCRCF